MPLPKSDEEADRIVTPPSEPVEAYVCALGCSEMAQTYITKSVNTRHVKRKSELNTPGSCLDFPDALLKLSCDPTIELSDKFHNFVTPSSVLNNA